MNKEEITKAIAYAEMKLERDSVSMSMEEKQYMEISILALNKQLELNHVVDGFKNCTSKNDMCRMGIVLAILESIQIELEG